MPVPEPVPPNAHARAWIASVVHPRGTVAAVRRLKGGITASVHASALFVLVGAEPHTDWLPATIQRDDRAFLLTGSDLRPADSPGGWQLQRPPLPLETSLPGVFAAGDVRRGSIKRVASAVGEGSIAATEVTQYLQERPSPRR